MFKPSPLTQGGATQIDARFVFDYLVVLKIWVMTEIFRPSLTLNVNNLCQNSGSINKKRDNRTWLLPCHSEAQVVAGLGL